MVHRIYVSAVCAVAAGLLVACGGGGTATDPPLSGAGIHLLAGSLTTDSRSCGWVDGQRSQARLGLVNAITVGPDGTIYLAEEPGILEGCAGEHVPRVRKVTAQGEVTTLAVGQHRFASPDPLTAFAVPTGIALDEQGNIYVSDALCPHGRCHGGPSTPITGTDGKASGVWRIATDGDVSILAGVARHGFPADGVGTQAQIFNAQFMVRGGDGLLYVFDRDYSFMDANDLRFVAMDGTVTTLSIPPSKDVHGMTVDAAGDVWINTISNSHPRIQASGVLRNVNKGFDTLLTTTNWGPLAIDSQGAVYTATTWTVEGGHVVHRYSPGSSMTPDVVVGDVGSPDHQVRTGPLPGRLAQVRAMAVGPDDALYILSGYALLKVVFD